MSKRAVEGSSDQENQRNAANRRRGWKRTNLEIELDIFLWQPFRPAAVPAPLKMRRVSCYALAALLAVMSGLEQAAGLEPLDVAFGARARRQCHFDPAVRQFVTLTSQHPAS